MRIRSPNSCHTRLSNLSSKIRQSWEMNRVREKINFYATIKQERAFHLMWKIKTCESNTWFKYLIIRDDFPEYCRMTAFLQITIIIFTIIMIKYLYERCLIRFCQDPLDMSHVCGLYDHWEVDDIIEILHFDLNGMSQSETSSWLISKHTHIIW